MKRKITIKNCVTSNQNKGLGKKNLIVVPELNNLIQNKLTKQWYKVTKRGDVAMVLSIIEVSIKPEAKTKGSTSVASAKKITAMSPMFLGILFFSTSGVRATNSFSKWKSNWYCTNVNFIFDLKKLNLQMCAPNAEACSRACSDFEFFNFWECKIPGEINCSVSYSLSIHPILHAYILHHFLLLAVL